MKTTLTIAFVAAISLTTAALASAAQPTQADFDACNRAAQTAGSNPSASPQSGGATGPAVTSPSGTPDSTAGVQPGGGAGKTGPMITGSGREPGTTGGVRQGTGAVTQDSSSSTAAGAAGTGSTGAAGAGGSGSAGAGTTGSTSGSSTSVSPAPQTGSRPSAGVAGPTAGQLTGMSDRGMSDPAYKIAYQDCMLKRGF
jgi:hypothetical protein